jgi:hypothetical protein
MTEKRQTTRPPGPDDPPTSAGPQHPPWWEEFQAAPPNGYGPSGRPGLPDLSPLFAILDALRRMVPVELQEQFNALQRELLLTVRALIDWYLERLEGSQRAAVVEDIPID